MSALAAVAVASEAAELAQIVGGWATAVAAVIALAGGGLALLQINANRDLAREVGARQAWDQYLRLCFDNAQYSCAKLVMQLGVTPENLFDVHYEGERYQWFLSQMLNASEQILLYVGDDGEWREALMDQIDYHRPLIDTYWARLAEHYSKPMQNLVDEALRRGAQS